MGSGKLIRAAIKKYGLQNFKKEILQECNEEELNNLEMDYIRRYDSQNKARGYNITNGGDDIGSLCSQLKTYYNKETDEEIRVREDEAVPKGFRPGRRPFSNETISKMVNKGENNGMYNKHRYGEANPFFGKKHTQETKDALSEMYKGTKMIINLRTLKWARVYENDLVPDGWEYVKEYYKKETPSRTEGELKEVQRKLRKEYWNKHEERVTCPYCGKCGRGVGFFRWHMNNCKDHPTLGEQNKEKHANWFKEHGNRVKGKKGTTNNKICITDGCSNKFIFLEDIDKYPGWVKGMTKRS